jgi:hypothetical protein
MTHPAKPPPVALHPFCRLEKSRSLLADVLKNEVSGEHRVAEVAPATAREFASCALFIFPVLLNPMR